MSLKNWDNQTWLSSKKYIQSFNSFLLKQTTLNMNSHILDIGCGRGKILGSLSSRLKLKKKPVGIDIEIHRDRDKRINFKKIDAIKYLKSNKKKFDLILIKQSRDKKIIKFLSKLYPKNKKRKFSFKVKISKNKYLEMIKNRYISTLLYLNSNQILKGVDELNYKYKKKISFNDKLICLTLL